MTTLKTAARETNAVLGVFFLLLLLFFCLFVLFCFVLFFCFYVLCFF